MTKIYIPIVNTNKNLRREIRIGIDSTGVNTLEEANRFSLTNAKLSIVGSFPLDKAILEDFSLDLSKAESINTRINLLVNKGIEPLINLVGFPPFMNQENFNLHKDRYTDILKDITLIYPYVKQFQIWNEPDFSSGVDPWGIQYIDNYIELLKLSRGKIKDRKLTIGLGLDNYNFLKELIKRNGLNYIDYINIHSYNYYNRTLDSINTSLLREKVNQVRELTNNFPIQITELNLINDNNSNPEYESYRTLYISNNILESIKLNIDMVMIYSWNSGWRNANIKDTPSEKLLSILIHNTNTI